MSRPTFVLIHGAWAGPWVWDGLLGPLSEAGFDALAVALPGVGPGVGSGVGPGAGPGVGPPPTEPVGLDELSAAVLNHIDGVDGPLILVGHSGGGVVATQVAEAIPDRVAGVAFLAAMMLPSGTSFADVCDGAGLDPPVGISRFLFTGDDGEVTLVPPEAAVAVFFHEASVEDAVAAARRLAPQRESARLIAPSWTPERFGRLPRLYIEATLDRTVPLAAQRRMQELVPGAAVVSLDSDHAPQLSRPAELLAALTDFGRSVTA